MIEEILMPREYGHKMAMFTDKKAVKIKIINFHINYYLAVLYFVVFYILLLQILWNMTKNAGFWAFFNLIFDIYKFANAIKLW